MPVITAKSAGFCFGVERAVNIVEREIEAGNKISTLGPIIHNPQVAEHFADKGVRIIETPEENPQGYKIVIRSHGVGQDIYNELEQLEIPYLDATCPFVAKIHRIVSAHSAGGAVVLIAGDKDHPEVRGIMGHCHGEYAVFSSCEHLQKICQNHNIYSEKNYIMVSQTTFNMFEWQKCVEFAKKAYTKIRLFDTICSATMKRQDEAAILSEKSDCMVVVGGKGSSNTAKLFEICSRHCRSVLVESADELFAYDFGGAVNIGVTAGASTPAFIIKEVQKTMSEIFNQQDELSFEEMLEMSLKTIYSGEKVTAVVTNISPTEIAVDIGTKHAGYVPLGEFTDDPNAKLEELVKVGDELELLVQRVNDVEGTAMLSKKRLDAIAGFEKVMKAHETEEILEGVVVDVVRGGIIVLSNGVRVFVPASQATASRGEALEDLLKKKVNFKIIETNQQRRRAVGSIRAVLKEQRKVLEEKFWQDVEVDKVYNGTVKSLTSYGAFVDLGGVDGMVHISELSWSRIKHPSEVVSIGDMLEVFVKEVDKENHRISLGFKKKEDSPWEILKRDRQIGDVCKVKIVSMTPYGAFAQVIPGVDGLIHISQISNERVDKPADVLAIGQEVDVKITDIDYEKKRVSLSMRALLPQPEAASAEDEAPALVYEAGPDTPVAVEEPAEAAAEQQEPPSAE